MDVDAAQHPRLAVGDVPLHRVNGGLPLAPVDLDEGPRSSPWGSSGRSSSPAGAANDLGGEDRAHALATSPAVARATISSTAATIAPIRCRAERGRTTFEVLDERPQLGQQRQLAVERAVLDRVGVDRTGTPDHDRVGIATVQLRHAALADETQLAPVCGRQGRDLEHHPRRRAEDRRHPRQLAADQLRHRLSRRRHLAEDLKRDREVVGADPDRVASL